MFVLFDIGGTKMRIASSSDGKNFGKPVKVPTPDSYDDALRELSKATVLVSGGEKIKAAAGGFAGPFNKDRSRLLAVPNLSEGWENYDIKKDLEKIFSAPVFLENDTALAGLGEAHEGAARGYEISAYITVSTGVGGARIVGGKIDRAHIGFEPGHQYINYEKELMLENIISGTSFEKRFGKKAYEVDNPAVWDETARVLAYGLHNTILHWSPEVLILGGSMITGNPAISLEKTEKFLEKIMWIFPELPEIKKAELGDDGGLFGALEFVKQNINLL